ncbi:Asp-tRNA(Asn)/Glu-tRNA(Gln) amidotransferase subunit GatA [Brachybacterium sp. ACRRE]|uniref:Asp-tRNA(Asn)/Glu-tRNA(Gln) amidotransferase subunit GatA n=1 Tax=Brachybacterium sp. ACRRE TaxID=2918184 RepID=UPI001EF31AC6|nr:Asp-tRNA(Asn)/Glu-tRNA(Gln) amidotransferase subunit GatA [Brachybacterium sp. ACRRE]MCG7307910.1 Asp-tRNA(Asn)/Glu-tRNA(Gln) amidotransferase subunit GatA [Brachybacterium sp. ACRRE]
MSSTESHPSADPTRLSAAAQAQGLASGDFSSEELTRAHLDRIAAVDGDLNAFLHVSEDAALEVARDVDERRAAGEQLHALAGVPIAVKDVVVTKGTPTTAASKILEGWVPPYDATLVEKLRAARLPILGKTNMDEFAMGSSTENSAFGPTRNPWDRERIPGGSGGGSAAAVGAYEAPLAIGTDTGGSIRQPASVTGTVGVKPTYGSVSRYGLIAMASSLDQAGPVTRTVEDAALLHELIAGHDARDSTSLPEAVPAFGEAARRKDVTGLRVGVIEELEGDGFAPEVRARFEESLAALERAGAEIIRVSCPNFEYALGAYYLIMPSEASSNLAKFDGMRYGLRVVPEDHPTAESVMKASRGAGFGDEVKRRILLGTYALSAGYYDAYYGSAQKVRTLVQNDFAGAFEQVDVLASPTSPTVAFRLGEKTDDPLAMYMNDIATIPANLAGVPGLSLPSGLAEDGLPAGIQFLAPARADERLYRVGGALEALLEESWGGPLLDRAPALTGAPTGARTGEVK